MNTEQCTDRTKRIVTSFMRSFAFILKLVMASARIPTSRIRMPYGIEHFVVVLAVLLDVRSASEKERVSNV